MESDFDDTNGRRFILFLQVPEHLLFLSIFYLLFKLSNFYSTSSFFPLCLSLFLLLSSYLDFYFGHCIFDF